MYTAKTYTVVYLIVKEHISNNLMKITISLFQIASPIDESISSSVNLYNQSFYEFLKASRGNNNFNVESCHNNRFIWIFVPTKFARAYYSNI